MLFISRYTSTVLKENKYDIEIKSKLQGYITGYYVSHSSSTAKWKNDDMYSLFLQSFISTTSSSSMGGMISNLTITFFTDYSKCFEMLFQLEKHTKALWPSSSLHLMTCLETLNLTGIVIDDSHIVSNGLNHWSWATVIWWTYHQKDYHKKST